MENALERLRDSYKATLAGKPFIDADEILSGSMFAGYSCDVQDRETKRTATFTGENTTAILDQIETSFGTRPSHLGSVIEWGGK
jgi:hypothetical protein